MHRRHRHRDPAPAPRLQLSHPFARIVLGGTLALAVLGTGAFVFGPFSDLSEQQLVAGPQAQAPNGAPATAVLARTGRSWAKEARQRQTAASAAAASAPLAQIARRDTPSP